MIIVLTCYIGYTDGKPICKVMKEISNQRHQCIRLVSQFLIIVDRYLSLIGFFLLRGALIFLGFVLITMTMTVSMFLFTSKVIRYQLFKQEKADNSSYNNHISVHLCWIM